MSLQMLAGQAYQEVSKQPTLPVFSPLVLAFLADLSDTLLRQQHARQHPELAALGFWLRPANMERLRRLLPEQDGQWQRPLGTVVHYTPANVDTMFVYSWVCALLMGNNNLVRVSTQDSAVKALLLGVLRERLAQPSFAALGMRNAFFTYPRDDSLSADISLLADARVIWGGDDSVNAIRRLPCKPRCRDIAFADRYSAALINGDQLAPSSIQPLAEALWRDTKPYAQMACSSPRVLFWLGDPALQPALMAELQAMAGQSIPAIQQATEHLLLAQRLQAMGLSVQAPSLGAVSSVPMVQWDAACLDWHSGQHLFYILPLTSLEQLETTLDEKCQTLSYWGMDKGALLRFFRDSSITGVDRIVPIGQALDFSPVWDGYLLFEALSNTIVLE